MSGFWEDVSRALASLVKGTERTGKKRFNGIDPSVANMIATASFARKTKLEMLVGPRDIAIMPVFYFVFDKSWKQPEIKLPMAEGLEFWKGFEEKLRSFSHGGIGLEPYSLDVKYYKIHTLTEPLTTDLRFIVARDKQSDLPEIVGWNFKKGKPGVYIEDVPPGVLTFRCISRPKLNSYRILGQGKEYGSAWAIDVTIVPSYTTGSVGTYYEPFFLVHIGAPYNDTPEWTQFDSWLLSIVNWASDIVLGIIGGILKGVSGGYIDIEKWIPRMRESDFTKRTYPTLPKPRD